MTCRRLYHVCPDLVHGVELAPACSALVSALHCVNGVLVFYDGLSGWECLDEALVAAVEAGEVWCLLSGS
jgi:hypothetical protein